MTLPGAALQAVVARRTVHRGDRQRRAVGHAESLRARTHQGGGLAGDSAVVADAVHKEIAVRGRRAAPGVVQEGDGDGVCTRGPVALEDEVLADAGRMRGGGGEGAAQLLAIELHGELGIAQIRILRHAEDQRVGSCPGGDRGRRRLRRPGHSDADRPPNLDPGLVPYIDDDAVRASTGRGGVRQTRQIGIQLGQRALDGDPAGRGRGLPVHGDAAAAGVPEVHDHAAGCGCGPGIADRDTGDLQRGAGG